MERSLSSEATALSSSFDLSFDFNAICESSTSQTQNQDTGASKSPSPKDALHAQSCVAAALKIKQKALMFHSDSSDYQPDNYDDYYDDDCNDLNTESTVGHSNTSGFSEASEKAVLGMLLGANENDDFFVDSDSCGCISSDAGCSLDIEVIDSKLPDNIDGIEVYDTDFSRFYPFGDYLMPAIYKKNLDIGSSTHHTVPVADEYEGVSMYIYPWIPETLLSVEISCPICLERICKHEVIYLLGCCHCFHKNCIQSWFELHNLCPICKKEWRLINQSDK